MDRRTKMTVDAYNKVAPKYAKSNLTYSFWSKEFKELSRRVKGKRVLEIGCGAGRDAKVFLDHNFLYVGVDASTGLLKIAKRKNPLGGFQEMDFYNLRFPPHSFDAIWSVATLLHAPKRRLPKVLRSVWRLLKPRGVFVVSIKEKRGFEEQSITQSKYGGVTRFFAFYSKFEFSRLLQQAGFSVKKTFRKTEDENVWISFVCEIQRKRGKHIKIR